MAECICQIIINIENLETVYYTGMHFLNKWLVCEILNQECCQTNKRGEAIEEFYAKFGAWIV